MTKQIFRKDNTEGYSDAELAALNEEAETRIPELMEQFGLDEQEAEKQFADEVAGR